MIELRFRGVNYLFLVLKIRLGEIEVVSSLREKRFLSKFRRIGAL
ncbi:hypothetical protein VIBNIAM115_650067 [Vibrio nigripulchritudo AM115]|nr:hypothetical protein VIBNIAM115_650067 [Vibrio nigripulchritudo AM115]